MSFQINSTVQTPVANGQNVVFGSSNIAQGNWSVAIGDSNVASGNYSYTFNQGYSGTYIHMNMTLEETEDNYEFCENNHADHVTFKDQYDIVEDINKKLIEMPFGGFIEE